MTWGSGARLPTDRGAGGDALGIAAIVRCGRGIPYAGKFHGPAADAGCFTVWEEDPMDITCPVPYTVVLWYAPRPTSLCGWMSHRDRPQKT